MRTDPEELERLRRMMADLHPAGPPRARIVQRAPGNMGASAGCLGVLDASFNPMTLAHHGMVEKARRTCGLNEVLLMLSRSNVDKKVFGADLGQRLAMLLAYAEGRSDISVAGCSHARFIDKAEALRALYVHGTRFYFIVGYDTLQRLFDPGYYADMQEDLHPLFETSRIVAANRGCHGLEHMRTLMERPECRPFTDRVDFIHLAERYTRISSTQVRQRRRRGEPIRDLVLGEVAEAIEAMGLYLH